MGKFNEIEWTIRAVMLHDRRAFDRLVERHAPLLRRFFVMQTCGDVMTADDLTQDSLIAAWQSIGKFSMKCSFGTWLHTIAYRRWVDYCRRRRPDLSPLSEAEDVLADDPPVNYASLHEAIALLPPAQRLCITMFYMNSLSVKAISAITGLSQESVRSNLNRGRNKLKKLIDKDGNRKDS